MILLFFCFNSEIEKTEKDQVYPYASKEKSENILLLAVANQESDFLYTNNTKDNQTSSPAKLNVHKIYIILV